MELVKYLKVQLRDSATEKALEPLLKSLMQLPGVETAFVVPVLPMPEYRDHCQHRVVWVRLAEAATVPVASDLSSEIARNPLVKWAEPSAKDQRIMLEGLLNMAEEERHQ